MTEVLSEAWFDAVNESLTSVPPGPGGNAVVALEVSGGGSGTVLTHWVVQDGRLASVRPADEAAADATIPVRHDLVEQLVSGHVDPAVEFMRGNLKPEGASAAVLALLSALANPECRAALAG